MITKALIRSCVYNYRKQLDQQAFAFRNELLIRNIHSFITESHLGTIHTFLPIERNNEPDLRPLFPELWSSEVHLVVSKTDFKNHWMRHYYLEPTTALANNQFDIPEPVNARPANLQNVEVIFIPLLLADKKGYRVGYGGGYYDQMLKECEARKVGISLSSPVDYLMQKDDWDQKLDVLITPYNRYDF